jgi:RNA polymerase sigma factor (sigma-70 family)
LSDSLRYFIEQNAQMLFNNLRVYVKRSTIATWDTVDDVTRSVLNDVVVEALKHEDRFDPDRGRPIAWLLGIGANVIQRRRQAISKRNHREPNLHDLMNIQQAELSVAELWEQVANLTAADPADQMQEEERLWEILGLVPEEDQHVITLAILHEMNGQELAQALHVNPGAARMRLHRALRRLQQAWQQHEPQY